MDWLGSGQATQARRCHSEVVVALQQGGDSILQGHGHLLGGLAQQWAVGVVLLQVQDVALLALRRAATLLTHVQLGPPLLVRVLLLHAMDLLEMRLQRAALREGLVTQAALVGPHACREESAGCQGADRSPVSSFPTTARPGHLTLGERNRGGLSRLQLPEGPNRLAEGGFRPSSRTPLPGCGSPTRQGLEELTAPPQGAPLTGVGADVSLQVECVIEALPTVGAQVPLDVVVTLHVAIQHALVGEGLLADVASEEVSTGTVPQGHLWARMVFVTAVQEQGLQVGMLGGCKHRPPAAHGKPSSPSGGRTSAPLAHRSALVGLEGTFGSMVRPAVGFPNPLPPAPLHL